MKRTAFFVKRLGKQRLQGTRIIERPFEQRLSFSFHDARDPIPNRAGRDSGFTQKRHLGEITTLDNFLFCPIKNCVKLSIGAGLNG